MYDIIVPRLLCVARNTCARKGIYARKGKTKHERSSEEA